MLSPVPAVANAIGLTPSKQATVNNDSLVSLVSQMPDGAVALSRAANASLEGKLNILLLAARERMIESLLDVVDAVSDALNLPQETGESSGNYALRLADAIANLGKPQLAALQQKLASQGQTLPLPLIAAALHDPTSQEAAQIVAYLEVVRYKERDLATKAVVSSYGQNAGASEPDSASRSVQPAAQFAAKTGAGLSDAALQSPLASSQQASVSVLAEALATMAEPEIAPADTIEQIIPNPLAAEAAVADVLSGEPESKAILPQQVVPQQVAGTAEEASQAPNLPAAAPDAEQPAPVALEERLKAVVKLAIDAAGPEILDILADSERLAHVVVAQALIADVLDDQDLAFSQSAARQPAEDQGDHLPTRSIPIAGTPIEADIKDAPSIVRLFVPSAPATAQSAAAEIAAAPQQPLPLGVPFAVAQYLPVDERTKDERKLTVDRVDPIDGESKGGHEQKGDRDEDESGQPQPEVSAGEDETIRLADTDDLDAIATPRDVAPAPLALPRPQPAASPAFDFYQRMVDWE